jgi:uncharacterized iron-regulated membrane protein
MTLLRTIIFWSHLVIGLTAGLIIAMMAFTGTTMAFEKQLIAWAERGVAAVKPAAPGTPRLSIDELQKKFREMQPEGRPSMIAVSVNPNDAVIFTAGRESIFYANPYTGDIAPASAPKLRAFLHTMEECHRWLTLSGDKRDLGKAITGATASLFFLLALSGFYLWWPRNLTGRGFKAIMTFNFQLSGKARDWNWHNTIGFWCLPVIMMTTLTGVIMSYRWANDALFRLTGTEPPAQQEGPGAAPAFEIKRPTPDARPVGYDALLASAQKDFPQWDVITIRLGGGRQRGGATPPAAGEKRPAAPAEHAAPREGEPRREGGGENRRAGPQPVVLAVHEPGRWPRSAATTLTFNPFTAEVLNREDFADQSAGRRARIWARYLHTGDALGLVGQFAVTVSALGILFLVYTGFALAWRRFFGKRPAATALTK